ncbi:MAG TPA: DUF3987 domain-containing protein [Alicyclobacillus sp.]|nr:DUF3987 domain-containing protein [Alicyclobacillus sp.]
MKEDKQARPPLPQGIIDLERVRRARQAREDFEDEAVLIPFKTEPVLPFPVEIYPEPVRRLVVEGTASLNCPADYFGLPMLSVASTLIGASAVIQPKEDRVEYARIWTLVVGHPGSAKTPAMGKVMAPLHAVQKRYSDIYELAKAQYEEDLANWNEDKKNRRRPEPPVMDQIYTTDTTMEALMDLLARTPRGVMLYQEEAAGWVLGFNQYKGGRGSDKQQVLCLWDGTPIMINRKGRQVYIERPFVSILGGIQPRTLIRMKEDMSEDDGFMHRFLIAFPDRVPKKRTKDVISEEAVRNWNAVCQALSSLRMDGDRPSTVLQFDGDGFDAWQAWLDTHYTEQNDPDFPEHLLGPWSKLETYFVRLALVIHLLRVMCEEVPPGSRVDAETVRRIVLLMEYLKSHNRRAYAALRETPEDYRVRQAVEWMKRHGSQTTVRDFQRAGASGVKTSSEARKLLDTLVDRGHAYTVHEGRTVIYKLVTDEPGAGPDDS